MNPVLSDPEICGGTPCFTGTRVPVASLFDHLRAGYNVPYFLYHFPSVTMEMVDAVLKNSEDAAISGAERSQEHHERAA